MRITILCENSAGHNTSKICLAEWGFSAYLQTGSCNVLFDTGHSGIFRSNAEKMGIDLSETDFVALSHRHWDHVEGLLYHSFSEKKKLIMHPLVAEKLPPEHLGRFEKDFKIMTAEKPFEFSEGVFFLGTIPRKTSFESGIHKGEVMLDDTAVAIKTPMGAAVLTGCSHSGICNICEYAKEVTGQKLYSVTGGFHLTEDKPEAVQGTIRYFKKENIGNLFPMHCVDFPTLARFYNEFGIVKHSTGDVIEI